MQPPPGATPDAFESAELLACAQTCSTGTQLRLESCPRARDLCPPPTAPVFCVHSAKVSIGAGVWSRLRPAVGRMGVLDPRGEYGKRLDAHIQTITRRSRQHILLGNSKLAVIAV